jgi:hypothetical protein
MLVLGTKGSKSGSVAFVECGQSGEVSVRVKIEANSTKRVFTQSNSGREERLDVLQVDLRGWIGVRQRGRLGRETAIKGPSERSKGTKTVKCGWTRLLCR